MARHMKTDSPSPNSPEVHETQIQAPVGIDSLSDPSEQSQQAKRLTWIIPLSILGVLAAIYLGGVVLFSFFMMPGSNLDNSSIAWAKASDVAASQTQAALNRNVHITGQGVDLTVNASDVGATVDKDGYAHDLINQSMVWAWPVQVFMQRTLSPQAGLTINSSQVTALLKPAIDQSRAHAAEIQSSGLTFDATAGEFKIDESLRAQYLDTDKVSKQVEEALASGTSNLVLGDDCLTQDDALEQAAAKANTFVKATLSLTMANTEVAKVDAPLIAQWVSIGSDLSVTLNRDAIVAWGKGELSQKLDTVGTERTYTRPDGKVVTVNDGSRQHGQSVYGWIIDGEATANSVADAIEAGKPATVPVAVTQEAAAYAPGGQDWGSRYIDVDISEQHARFYDNGQLIWEADLVTGQPNLNRETPTGVWTITNSQSGDINLRGPVDPATQEPQWDSHVQFWMGVVRNLVGFHNAPWRSSFGGSIYKHNGSHGCLNLSYDKAQALHSLVQVGDVVVIHK